MASQAGRQRAKAMGRLVEWVGATECRLAGALGGYYGMQVGGCCGIQSVRSSCAQELLGRRSDGSRNNLQE